MARIQHYIGGAYTQSGSVHWGNVYNPATGETIHQVAFADAIEVDTTVRIANKAFSSWASTPSSIRSAILSRFGELLRKEAESLAALITEENGKTLAEARGEIARGIQIVEFSCGMESYLKGEFSAQLRYGVDCWSIRQPLGVCVGITPSNFPAMVPLWMFPIALACGNTFILKPSEHAPSASLRLAEFLTCAGLPAGVFNVINGGEETGRALLTHSQVAAVSFVGSTAVAKRVYATAAQHAKRVQAFGGAKNHLIVTPTADIDKVVDALVYASFGSAGQRCMAVSVVVVIGTASTEFLDKLVARIKTLKIGPGTHAETEMGPLISRDHLQDVCSYIDLGLREGAHLLIDGRDITVKGYEKGFFLGPSIFDSARSDMKIYKEEVFGPVLLVMHAENFADAMSLVNSSEYGNGAAIFTQNGRIARAFAAQVQVGMVGINVPVPVPPATYSFGGWKSSRFGDTAMHGIEGVRFYSQLKTVTASW